MIKYLQNKFHRLLSQVHIRDDKAQSQKQNFLQDPETWKSSLNVLLGIQCPLSLFTLFTEAE